MPEAKFVVSIPWPTLHVSRFDPKTASARFTRSLKRIAEWCREHRHYRGVSTIFEKEYGNDNRRFFTQANSTAYGSSLNVEYFLARQK